MLSDKSATRSNPGDPILADLDNQPLISPETGAYPTIKAVRFQYAFIAGMSRIDGRSDRRNPKVHHLGTVDSRSRWVLP